MEPPFGYSLRAADENTLLLADPAIARNAAK